MTATIQAELKLIPTAGNGSIPGFGDMASDIKDMARAFKRPSNVLGGGGGGLMNTAGLIGAGSVGAVAGAAVVGLFGLWFKSLADEAETERNRIIAFYEHNGVNISQPNPSEVGPGTSDVILIDQYGLSTETRLADETAKRSKYVEELNSLQQQFNEIAKDGLTTEEKVTAEKILQRVENITHEAAQNNLTESRSKALDIEIHINDVLSKQKQTMEEMSRISVTMSNSRRGRETGDIISDFTFGDQNYTGKIVQTSALNKNSKTFIGVRTVA